MNTGNVPVSVPAGTIEVPLPEPKKPSAGIQLLTVALSQVNETLDLNTKTLQMLQQNLTQVTNQKIELTAQQKMLVELKAKLEQLEAK